MVQKALKLKKPKNNIHSMHFVSRTDKEDLQLFWVLNAGTTIVEDKLWVLGMDCEKLIHQYRNGICPICDSSNTRRHPLDKSLFWGCKDCGYGYWDTFLANFYKEDFYIANNLNKELEKYLANKKEAKKSIEDKLKIYNNKNNKNKETCIQLSLF